MSVTLIGSRKGFGAISASLLLLAGSLVAAGACRFGPGEPDVERATLWMDSVERGDLMIERRGAGQLLEDEAGELIAELRIPQTQSLELEIGQPAIVDVGAADVDAVVAALADEIVGGTRLVRLTFTGELPEELLPGMEVDGTIRVDTVADVLFVGKPAYGQANSRLGLFRIVDEGRFAERVEVETGRSSVNLIQIVAGLEEGDEIILSDMSRYDVASRVALR